MKSNSPTYQPLKLSPKNRQVGLFVYCNACKGEPKGSCTKGGKCDNPERQVYKVRFHVPGTSKGKKTKVLEVRDEDSAVKLAIKLRSEFKHQVVTHDAPKYNLFDYIIKFLDFKKNPAKNQKPISEYTIKDYSLHLRHFSLALIEKGMNPKVVDVNEVNDKMAEVVFQYLLKQFPSSITHKKYFGTYETFCNHLIKIERFNITNPFTGWRFDKKEEKNEIIHQDEFNNLLEIIDTAPQYYSDPGGTKRKAHYTWLRDGIKLSLFTGGRRQEIPLIKWTDIILNRLTGELPGGVIMLRDIKNTNIKKLDQVKLKPVEINYDLAELLFDMGYNQMKGEDKYILDPNEAYKRDFIKEYLSKSFAHYIQFVTKRSLSFKCLRKTWFTNCSKAVGDKNAAMLGGHSNKNVTLAHYINQIEAAGTGLKFSRIFLPPFPPSGHQKVTKVAKFSKAR